MRLSLLFLRHRPSTVEMLIRIGLVISLFSVSYALSTPAKNDDQSKSASEGKFISSFNSGQLTIGNAKLSATWEIADGHFKSGVLQDLIAQTSSALGSELFVLNLEDTNTLKSSELQIIGNPELTPLATTEKNTARTGTQITVHLRDKSDNVHVVWRAIGRDNTNYVRQKISLEVQSAPLPLREIVMIDWALRFPYVAGTGRGAPIVAGNLFCGAESPMSASSIEQYEGKARSTVRWPAALVPGQKAIASSVVGVTRPGQLRRDFQSYLEAERPRPYRMMVNYNSWFDLGTPIDAKNAMASIEGISDELRAKRHVKVDSYLLDDGWDNPDSVWDVGTQFPDGLSPLAKLTARQSAGLGLWLSPWGGYHTSFKRRTEAGQKLGYQIAGRFTLCDPKYYARFRDVCVDAIKTQGVNLFKFDGTSDAASRINNSRYASDFDAAIDLFKELREARADLFINLTTGTWPSPFFLRHVDSIWRGGADIAYAGVGSWRQRWITYRDGDTYTRVVRECPLFPLNSLMLHGLAFGKGVPELSNDTTGDFKDEIYSQLGSGTQLQELYFSPGLLSAKNWDDVAEAITWGRENADTLIDSHWVGGNPMKGDVYGWASWSPRKGILVLRNPSDRPAAYTLDIGSAFELPQGAAKTYTIIDRLSQSTGGAALECREGQPVTIELAPFKLLVLDAVPLASVH